MDDVLSGWDLIRQVLLFQLLIAWPTWRIFKRSGLNPLWALLVLVPVIGTFLALVVLGHSKWPVVPPKPERRRRTR